MNTTPLDRSLVGFVALVDNLSLVEKNVNSAAYKAGQTAARDYIDGPDGWHMPCGECPLAVAIDRRDWYHGWRAEWEDECGRDDLPCPLPCPQCRGDGCDWCMVSTLVSCVGP